MQSLRKEAEEQAKKILNKTNLSKKSLPSKESTVKTFKSGKHAYLKQSQIDHCINNGMDIWYLYDELLSKYGGLDDIDKPKKVYYTPRGTPRGRPKKDNNEQEQ